MQDPAGQLETLIVEHYEALMSGQHEAQLMMRELLDNEKRAEKAGNWFLKPYLEGLVDIVLEVESTRHIGRARALAMVYQFLGAANYVSVSVPTLKRMFGTSVYTEMQSNYAEELRRIIRARLEQI